MTAMLKVRGPIHIKHQRTEASQPAGKCYMLAVLIAGQRGTMKSYHQMKASPSVSKSIMRKWL